MIENLILALVLIAQVLIVLYVIGFFVRRRHPESAFVKALSDNGFVLAFLVALTATLGSLYYSDIRGFTPCKFCWFQRIFMYPQVILLGIALWKKDFWMRSYSIILSVIGGLIALNHYILQITGVSFIPCSAIGYSISCNKIFVLKLGYITIPIMAITAFALIALALVFSKKGNETLR